MALKDLIEKVHKEEKVSAMILNYVASRKGDHREPGWHPSEFVGMCPRLRVLQLLTKTKGEPFEPSLLKIFDTGTAMHSWYQNEYFAKMGMLWGKWRCLRCDNIQWGYTQTSCNNSECPTNFNGLDDAWVYEEVPVRAKLPSPAIHDIVGHSDGIIRLSPSKHYLLEIKTINDRGFTWQKEAQEKHVQQARVYAELVQQKMVEIPPHLKKTIPALSGILMLYINKNNSVDKEYLLDLDSEYSRNELKRPMLVEEAMHREVLPCRLEECTNMLKNPAKKCPLVSYCFGGKTFKQLDRR